MLSLRATFLLLAIVSCGAFGAEESFENHVLNIAIEYDHLQTHLSHEAARALSRVNQCCAANIDRYRNKHLDDLNMVYGECRDPNKAIVLDNGINIGYSNVILDASGNQAYGCGIFLNSDDSIPYLCHFTYPALNCIAIHALDIKRALWKCQTTLRRTFGCLSATYVGNTGITLIGYAFSRGIVTMTEKVGNENYTLGVVGNSITCSKTIWPEWVMGMSLFRVLTINPYKVDEKNQAYYGDGSARNGNGNKLPWKPIEWKLYEKPVTT